MRKDHEDSPDFSLGPRDLRAARMTFDPTKGNFLAVMSHEIRTPLNGILGFADFMAIHPDLPDSLKEHVQTIQKSGRDLLRVVNDILNYSRLQEGSIELEHAEFSPRKVLQDVGDLLLPAAKAKGLDFRLEAPEALPSLLGDRTWLAQILLNIGGNAVKFTEKGSVVIGCCTGESMEPGKMRLNFFVKDTGIGIPPGRISQIFEAFEQADASTSRNYGGTGLGLAISRSLLDLMEGEIGVESEVGVGTTFRFSIAFDSAAPAAAPESAEPSKSEESRAVLVAEDNAINRRVIEKFLASFGYPSISVGDGAGAVEAFAAHRPRGVIMDLHMPGMGGIEATQLIRAFERENGLRPCTIIALTADVMPEERQRCFDAGMNLYLTKPIRPEDLEAAMKRAFAAAGQD